MIKFKRLINWNVLKNGSTICSLFKQNRCVHDSYASKQVYNLVELTNRRVIKVSGRDAFSYIQLISTNNLQQNQNCLNSYMIAPQSFILSDLLIYKIKGDVFDKELILNGLTSSNYGKRLTDCLADDENLSESNEQLVEDLRQYESRDEEEVLYVECDAKLADSVQKTLFVRKFKQDVNFEIVEDLRVYSAFQPIGDLNETFLLNDELISSYFCLVNDPRLPYLGQRIITRLPEDMLKRFLYSYSFKRFRIETRSLRDYRLHRYKLGVGEGFREHWVNQIMVNTFNGDLLNGLDLYKGGFTGRRTVKRTIDRKNKYMKRLLPFEIVNPTNREFENLPQRIEFLTTKNEHPIGELIRNVGNYGIGYFKLQSFVRLDHTRFVFVKFYHQQEKLNAMVRIPFWWPDLSKMRYLTYEDDLEYFRQELLEQKNQNRKLTEVDVI